jgi:hypothetical protein
MPAFIGMTEAPYFGLPGKIVTVIDKWAATPAHPVHFASVCTT